MKNFSSEINKKGYDDANAFMRKQMRFHAQKKWSVIGSHYTTLGVTQYTPPLLSPHWKIFATLLDNNEYSSIFKMEFKRKLC